MGALRRAILLIAASVIFASPSAAKVVKFEVLKVELLADGTLVPGSIDGVGFPPSRMAQPTFITSDGMLPSNGASYPWFVPMNADDRDRPALICQRWNRQPKESDRVAAIARATPQLVHNRLLRKQDA